MGLFDTFLEAKAAAYAQYGQGLNLPQKPPSSADATRDSGVSAAAFEIGRYYNHKTKRPGRPLPFEGERHCCIFGLNGAGKSTRLLIPLGMKLRKKSSLWLDKQGELAFQMADAMRQHCNVKIINPFNLHDMGSDGYAPLARIDPADDLFFDKCCAIGDALIDIEEGSGAHWSESAQGLLVGIIMDEIIVAKSEGRLPTLLNVRYKLTERDEYELYTDDEGKPKRRQTKGLAVTASKIIASGNRQLTSLIERFTREDGKGELASIASTGDTQTRWILSNPMARDMEKDGVDFADLRRRPTAIFVCLPVGEVSRMRRWTRVLVASALSVHFEPGPTDTIFVLDEFRSAIGKMQVLTDMWSLVRGFGCQIVAILQSATQLRALFKDEWENFPAQAGAVVCLGPTNDKFTADWMSSRCGVTTIAQMSFNASIGTSDGDAVGENDSQSGGKNSSGRNAGKNHGGSRSGSLNVSQVQRAAVQAQDLMDMPSGHGRIWVPGMGSKSIPFFAPHYFRRRSEAWVKDVKPNPFYKG